VWKDGIKTDPKETGCKNMRQESPGCGHDSVTRSCEQGNDTSVPMQGKEFLKNLKDYEIS
jgi:hypothetical protein